MPETRYAIIIGCNDYKDTEQFQKLKCAINDAQSFKKVFEDPKVCKDIAKYNTIIFTNGESSNEILPKVEKIITITSKSDDFILFFFSGHGKLDQRGSLYLALKDTDIESLDSTSISIERLMRFIDRSRSNNILLILDCCFSGAIKDLFRKSSVEDVFTAASQGHSVQILTSSTGIELSNEKEGDTNSIFTKFLLDGLETGNADTNNDGLITVEELYQYTFKLVKGTGLQTPMSFNLGAKGTMIIANNKQYESFNINSLSSADLKKYFAIKNMIDMLNSNDPPLFFIVLFNYKIEGETYRSSGLTISKTQTPNIRQTSKGFQCDAFFQPEIISEKGREGKEVINGVIKVRMEIDMNDILIISGKTHEGNGEQIDLYGV